MFVFRPTTERVLRLRKKVREAPAVISAERLRIVTEYYAANEDEPILLKRANTLLAIAEQFTPRVEDDELLVANMGPEYRSMGLYPEYGIDWIYDEIRSGAFDTREVGYDPYVMSQEDRDYLFTTEEFWKTRSITARMNRALPDGFFEHVNGSNCSMFNQKDICNKPTGHFVGNYGKVCYKGFGAVRDEALAKVKEMEGHMYGDDAGKYLFYRSIAISCQAAITFSKRYAALCLEKAETAPTEQRRKELLEMADVLSWILENPCRGFRDALQAILLYQFILTHEHGIHGESFGRADQYLYPYLKKDLESGALTIDQAQELMDCFCIKLNEVFCPNPIASTRNSSGYRIGHHTTIGGQLPDGSDATNEVSYMYLQSIGRLHICEPYLDIRVHKGTPRELLEAGVTVSRLCGGIPTFQNDDVIMKSLKMRGIPECDARDYAIVGCVELTVGSGKEWPACGGTGKETYFNLANCLLLAINNGINPNNGKKCGLPTGYLYEMKSFEEVKAAFEKQCKFYVDWQVSLTNLYEYLVPSLMPYPVISAMQEGCMEKGKDVQEGGAMYNSTGFSGVGTGNLGDSLAAIKYMVFDTKKYSARELYDAIISNWEGYESMRQDILANSPHWGNDNDYVDELTVWATDIFFDLANKGTGKRGEYRIGAYPVSAHVALGGITAATPDGRRKGEPLADGVGSMQGADKNGPIAAFNSVSKLSHYKCGNGTLMNMKFHPKTFEGEGATDKFIDSLLTFFDRGAMHLQFNVVSSDTLREAQKNPDEYRDLIIRVAGYSAYFVELYKAQQDELISRADMSF